MIRTIVITFLSTLALLAAVLHVPDASADRSLSREFVAECLLVARDVDPALAERLVTIREQKGEQEFAVALRNARHLVHLTRIRREDPALYDVKVRSLQADARADRLVAQLAEARRAGAPEAESLAGQLAELAADQVALDLAARGMYANKLQDHLDRLKSQLTQEGDNFFQTVERRHQRLLQRVDAMVEQQSQPGPQG